MSIGMTTNLRWSIVLNATGQEWHEFQHGIADKMAKSYLYAISNGKFTHFATLADGEHEFDVWARRDKSADVEFAIFPAAPK